MASRDKSQNVGFVYTNIYQLYKKAQNAPEPSSDSRVWRSDDLGEITITKFQPRTLTPSQPVSAQAAQAQAAPALEKAAAPAPLIASNPFDDLKSNISRLQDLHSRLRFMLKELEDLVEKK